MGKPKEDDDMAKYRHRLPQLEGGLFLTDAGIETTLIFHEGQELPWFAAFHLLKDENGTEVLRRYFRRHARTARNNGTGFIFESAPWRASPDWGTRLGYSAEALDPGDPAELGRDHRDLRRFPHINVLGGCCGTDHPHTEEICRACMVAA